MTVIARSVATRQSTYDNALLFVDCRASLAMTEFII